MSTIFEKIIAREIPAAFVYEDEQCIAIMDAFPSVPGQSMVIPREPHSYFADMPEDQYLHIMSVAKKIAAASDAAFDTARTCMVIEGFEVPHVHIKLYPISKASGVDALTDVITHTKPATEEERAVQAEQIKAKLN